MLKKRKVILKDQLSLNHVTQAPSDPFILIIHEQTDVRMYEL